MKMKKLLNVLEMHVDAFICTCFLMKINVFKKIDAWQ